MNEELTQAYQSLRGVLLNGRIIINGLPLTAVEINGLIRGLETMCSMASAKEAKPPQKPNGESNIKPLEKKK